jgi:hypothetical protein
MRSTFALRAIVDEPTWLASRSLFSERKVRLRAATAPPDSLREE